MRTFLKVVGIIILVLITSLYIAFVWFTSPKSDAEILKAYANSVVQPVISHHNINHFNYRKITVGNDKTLPTIVFVHGTIGSIADFSKYLSDAVLQQKANMIAYDRIGYNYKDQNDVQESIAFENKHLSEVLKTINPEKTIVVGYSYGGPIALSLKSKIKKIVLLAPAVYSKVEPIPWAINLYKSPLTKWLIPRVWKQASKEKLSHKQNLQQFQNSWHTTPNNVVAIHGNKDWIVPLSNSQFLEKQFLKTQFTLKIINEVGHGLVWSKFDEIKKELINQLEN